MNSGGGRRGKAKKANLRVDFTPMVDMNMLLLTFFMFCTTLSIPQVMDIVVPTKQKGSQDVEAPASRTITFLLGADDKIYYYAGHPDYEHYYSVKETDYSADGLRNILLERNSDAVAKAVDLKRKRKNKEISENEFKQGMAQLKKSDNGAIAIIKPTDKSSYKNLVDILDEMQVCSVSQYAIVDFEKSDEFLLENYKLQGKLTANAKF